MRKAKHPHPVVGLMNMIIGILTPMRPGDRDFQRFNLMRKPEHPAAKVKRPSVREPRREHDSAL